MKLNELIGSFDIFVTNEEKKLLEFVDRPLPLESFDERSQFILNNLIRKSLLSKVSYQGNVFVVKNDK